MSDLLPTHHEAIVICTRNRSSELARTLNSVAAQTGSAKRLVVVVDGSDPSEADRTTKVVEDKNEQLPVSYYRYSGPPAGTRQRNAGVEQLPSSVRLVHFLDDDITLKPGYFNVITEAFSQHSVVLGVGGIIEEPSTPPRPPMSTAHRLFLLSATRPSRVLPSGQTTPAWALNDETLQPAEWLSTCASSYRRRVFNTHRFAPKVEGPSPRLEDLDFSYRVAQDGPLAVAPMARCVHHVSPTNRRRTADAARERVARRYWFIEKNMDRPVHRLAFWWSVVGRMLICVFSSHPDSPPALRGLLQGIRAIWTRSHPLLQSDDEPQ
jgi:GT2 family glycosyltransferase